jgi:AbrB family looped-hinge helix DNA binding protein
MQASTLTSKGQVTIPADVRKQLGLRPGDRVGFIVEDGEVRLVRMESRIEAAFGICKTERSLSVEEMDEIVKQRARS